MQKCSPEPLEEGSPPIKAVLNVTSFVAPKLSIVASLSPCNAPPPSDVDPSAGFAISSQPVFPGILTNM